MTGGPVMTLGPKIIYYEVQRALLPPVITLLLTAAVVVGTHNGGWLSVGGAVIAALGTFLWAGRLLRVGAKRSDELLPPAALPMAPGDKAVAVNPDFFTVLQKQTVDNLRAYVGVWVTVAGGMIGSAGPFLLGLVWH